MSSKKGKKKGSCEKTTSKILLATAIIELLNQIIGFLSELLD